METILTNLCNKLNIELSERQVEQFLLYKDLLKEWNEKINLTAITDDKEIVIKHFIDSLTIAKYISDNDTIIDVGTGAGFPGIPIKIVKPDTEVTLLDSLNKRLLFLQDVIDENKLKKIRCVHGRAEDVSRETIHREVYDIATARAVANMSTLVELCIPFVKVGGLFVCMKGTNTDEIDDAKNAIKLLGGEIEKIDNFVLPDTDMERNIIIIRKVKNTPGEFPRKAGVPAKNPIK